MPFIQDMLRKRDQKDMENGLQEAIKIFDSQKQALENIQDTDGFKVIMEYLESAEDLYESKMSEDMPKQVFSDYLAVKNLKKFIKSRLK